MYHRHPLENKPDSQDLSWTETTLSDCSIIRIDGGRMSLGNGSRPPAPKWYEKSAGGWLQSKHSLILSAPASESPGDGRVRSCSTNLSILPQSSVTLET